MNKLADFCICWADQFRSDKIRIYINKNACDQYHEDHIQIQISPSVLNMPAIGIVVTKYGLGFSAESWGPVAQRLRRESPKILDSVSNPDYIWVGLEPGAASINQTIRILDAIAAGGLTLEARVFRNRLVGAGGIVKLGTEVVHLNGISLGADVLKYVSLVSTIQLHYSELSANRYSLEAQVQKI